MVRDRTFNCDAAYRLIDTSLVRPFDFLASLIQVNRIRYIEKHLRR